jgi:hypothetical protein
METRKKLIRRNLYKISARMYGFFGRGMNYFRFGSHLFIGAIIILIVALLFIAFAHNKRNKRVSNSDADKTLKMQYVKVKFQKKNTQK